MPAREGSKKAAVFRSSPSEAGAERPEHTDGSDDAKRAAGVRAREGSKKAAVFRSSPSEAGAERPERTSVREDDRRRDREGIGRKTPAFRGRRRAPVPSR